MWAIHSRSPGLMTWRNGFDKNLARLTSGERKGTGNPGAGAAGGGAEAGAGTSGVPL